MPYSVSALISVLCFAFVHLFAEKIRGYSRPWFLSAGGGVAIAHVFIDLLPKLCLSDQIVSNAGIFPFIERHVFIMALFGFLLFFSIDRIHTKVGKTEAYWISMASYALFNFLVGYAVVDQQDPEVQPLGLFTFAIALHYFVNDASLCEAHGNAYRQRGKWLLVVSLFLGWLTGIIVELPEAAVALVGAFIGGGVIMNVIRHELPKQSTKNLKAFLLATLFYAIILLTI